MFINA